MKSSNFYTYRMTRNGLNFEEEKQMSLALLSEDRSGTPQIVFCFDLKLQILQKLLEGFWSVQRQQARQSEVSRARKQVASISNVQKA